MASALPPVKNAVFSFEHCLVSQSDTDTFQDNPTLAAGDVKIIKDGTLDGNIDTLPTAVTSLTRVITVALSADEMNADRVAVLFHDAAGSEWQDSLVTIYTSGQTLDTTDGVVDGISAVKPDNKPTVAATGEASGNVTFSAGVAVTSRLAQANDLPAPPTVEEIDAALSAAHGAGSWARGSGGPPALVGGLAAMQMTAESTLTESAEIWRKTLAADGMGGTTETWALVGTVDCSKSAGLNQSEQAVADRLSIVRPWIVRVPADTDVTNRDRLVIEGGTYEVVSKSGGSVVISLRLLCQEVS